VPDLTPILHEPVRRVLSGFIPTEGPAWHPVDHTLTFTDVRGNKVWRWDGASLTCVREQSNSSNGLAFDLGGRLIACEMATARLTASDGDGGWTVLASHYEGRELNSPNDLVVRSDGSIYFSDPMYGRRGFSGYAGTPRAPELGFEGLYRLFPDGSLELVSDRLVTPNGVCFSPDEQVLYVAETQPHQIRAFTLDAGGRPISDKVLFQVPENGRDGPGLVDGVKTDSLGNVYLTGKGVADDVKGYYLAPAARKSVKVLDPINKFEPMIDYTFVTPIIEKWPQIRTIIHPNIQNAVFGKITADQAMSNPEKEINDILAKKK